MFGILEGLGPEYETFRTTMYCLKPQPEYEEVISQLERFETRLQTYSMNEYNSNLAYYGQRKAGTSQQRINPRNQRESFRGEVNYGRGQPFIRREYGNNSAEAGRNQFNRMNNMYSTQQGQVNKDNWSGYGQGFRPYSNSAQRYQNVRSYPPQSSNGDRQAQNTKPTNNVPLQCQICKKSGHTALRCWYRFDNSYQVDEIPTALAAVHIEEPYGSEWYPDTGATSHITSEPGMIQTSE